jgi:hypothetical protein
MRIGWSIGNSRKLSKREILLLGEGGRITLELKREVYRRINFIKGNAAKNNVLKTKKASKNPTLSKKRKTLQTVQEDEDESDLENEGDVVSQPTRRSSSFAH